MSTDRAAVMTFRKPRRKGKKACKGEGRSRCQAEKPAKAAKPAAKKADVVEPKAEAREASQAQEERAGEQGCGRGRGEEARREEGSGQEGSVQEGEVMHFVSTELVEALPFSLHR